MFNKTIDIEDFSSSEMLNFFRNITEIEMGYFGLKSPSIQVDAKTWETAMTLYALDRHGLLKKNKLLAALGKQAELTTSYLTNYEATIFPFASCPEQRFLNTSTDSEQLKSTNNILPIHPNAWSVHAPSNFFDGVYCSALFDNLKNEERIAFASAELARIVKPGGYVSIVAKFLLDGPEEELSFVSDYVLLTEKLITKYILSPSGLKLVDTLKKDPSKQTFQKNRNFVIQPKNWENTQTFEAQIGSLSSLIYSHKGFLFCPIHIFLYKPENWTPNPDVKCNIPISELSLGDISQILQSYPKHSEKSDWNKAFVDSSKMTYESSLFTSILNYINKKAKSYPSIRNLLIKVIRKSPKISLYLKTKIKEHPINSTSIVYRNFLFYFISILFKKKNQPK